MIIKEVNNNTAEKNLSKTEGDKSDLVTSSMSLHKQENGRLTEVSEKATFSTVHKFYKRRSCNQTLGSRKR
jgi:hypothetical protein